MENQPIRRRKIKTKDRPYRTPYYIKLKDTCDKVALFKNVIHDGSVSYKTFDTPPKRRPESPAFFAQEKQKLAPLVKGKNAKSAVKKAVIENKSTANDPKFKDYAAIVSPEQLKNLPTLLPRDVVFEKLFYGDKIQGEQLFRTVRFHSPTGKPKHYPLNEFTKELLHRRTKPQEKLSIAEPSILDVQQSSVDTAQFSETFPIPQQTVTPTSQFVNVRDDQPKLEQFRRRDSSTQPKVAALDPV